jgi:hypothetical protein
LVTCIPPPLLFADRIEGGVLEPPHFRLQQPQVHQSRAAVVIAYGFVDPQAADREDRHAAPVRAAHFDRLELATSHQPEGTEE